MQPVILPLAVLALLGAAQTSSAPQPSTAQPGDALPLVQPHAPAPEQCRDRITHAREATGKPPLLDRQPASPDKPYRIYAVDKRIDGCSVMVMHGDVSDIRPLPARPDGPILLMPAKAGQ